MKKVKGLAFLLVIVLAVVAVLQITSVRHAAVVGVWKVMDRINEGRAAKAVLPAGVRTEKDISYCVNGTAEQVLDAYYPDVATGKLPVVVFVHGGGFVACDKSQNEQFCMTIAKEGYSVFSINYRLAPNARYLDQLNDVLSAVDWVGSNCEKYLGDKNSLFLAGDSAGAYLASYTACLYTGRELASRMNLKANLPEGVLKGILLYSGLYDLKTGAKSGFPSIRSDIEMFLGTGDIDGFDRLADLSVLNNITEKFPRAFVSSGAIDWLHPESVALIAKLTARRVPISEVLYGKNEFHAMHDYQFDLSQDTAKQCLKKTLEFLKTASRS